MKVKCQMCNQNFVGEREEGEKKLIDILFYWTQLIIPIIWC